MVARLTLDQAVGVRVLLPQFIPRARRGRVRTHSLRFPLPETDRTGNIRITRYLYVLALRLMFFFILFISIRGYVTRPVLRAIQGGWRTQKVAKELLLGVFSTIDLHSTLFEQLSWGLTPETHEVIRARAALCVSKAVRVVALCLPLQLTLIYYSSTPRGQEECC